jgi:hypothetical protein
LSWPSESGTVSRKLPKIGVILVISVNPGITGAFEYFLQTGRLTGIGWVKQESILNILRGLDNTLRRRRRSKSGLPYLTIQKNPHSYYKK